MSAPDKKKAKPDKKKVSARRKAKVTRTKKVTKEAVAKKPRKAAPKAKKAPEKKEVPQKAVAKAEPVELGPAPVATVQVRHVNSGSLHERAARGFSFGELNSAGVPLNAAKREGLSLDIRRRSVVEGNVEVLKGWFKSAGATSVEEERVAVAAVRKKPLV